jgi:hypothetical protein
MEYKVTLKIDTPMSEDELKSHLLNVITHYNDMSIQIDLGTPEWRKIRKWTWDIKGLLKRRYRINQHTMIDSIYVDPQDRICYLGRIERALKVEFTEDERENFITLDDIHTVVMSRKD